MVGLMAVLILTARGLALDWEDWIQMDAEIVVSSGWLTSLAVMKVGGLLRVVKIWMVALLDSC